MAPDAPGNLVVLDLSYDRDGKLVKTVEDVEPSQTGSPGGWLRVRFDEAPSEGFYAVGGGVAYVRQPDGYEHTLPSKRSEVLTLPGNRHYFFNNVAQGEGLQLILILPKGFTLSEFSPTPSNAKKFRDRIAVYFRPKERFGETAKVTFALRGFDEDVALEAQRLRGEFLKPGRVPDNSGAYVDREDPEFKELNPQQPLSPFAYALIALAGLAIGVGLVVFYVHEGPKLAGSGSGGQIFYVLLIPWALASAAFLFGAMRSYARFTHKHLGNAIELGGPVVIFCLIVVGGFKLARQPPPPTFDLTVRPYSSDGTTPIIHSGKIILDLDNDRREGTVGSNGEADFKGIPGRFIDTTVTLLPQVQGYRQQPQHHRLSGSVLELPLEPEPVHLIHLLGSIVPAPQNWRDLHVIVEGQPGEAEVNSLGKFDFAVSGKDGEVVRVRVISGRKTLYDDDQPLPGPLTIMLHDTSQWRNKNGETRDTSSNNEARDTAFLLGYYAAFALAHAKLGSLDKQETSRINSYLEQLKLNARFPEDPMGPAQDAQPAAEFAKSVLGSLEATSPRQYRAFALGWFGVITTNTPSLKPVGFDLRTYVQEAGYTNRGDLSDAALLEHLIADARKRRQ